MTESMAAGAREKIIRRSALRRQAEVSDVAGAVDYLLSEQARNITGTVLTVDAGSTA
jgi:3-oxoacyl-[acyl-carrier protein] reductase